MEPKQTKEEKLYNLLKINTISYLICNTNLGKLELNYRKGEEEPYYTLDSVRLEDKEVKEALKLWK